jgi:hypothetical protein
LIINILQPGLMIKLITLLLVCCSVHVYAQNVGIGTTTPSNSLHIVSAANPLRLEGLQPGDIADSIITIDSTGVLRKRSGAFTVSLTGWSTTGNGNTNTAAAVIMLLDTRHYRMLQPGQPILLSVTLQHLALLPAMTMWP